jgi:hypothetical protein
MQHEPHVRCSPMRDPCLPRWRLCGRSLLGRFCRDGATAPPASSTASGVKANDVGDGEIERMGLAHHFPLRNALRASARNNTS